MQILKGTGAVERITQSCGDCSMVHNPTFLRIAALLLLRCQALSGTSVRQAPANDLQISCKRPAGARTTLRSAHRQGRSASRAELRSVRACRPHLLVGCAAHRAVPLKVIAQCRSSRTESAGLGRWTSRRKQGSTAPSAKMPTTVAVSRPVFSTPVQVAAGM
jgi:hypothetical protein